MRLPIRIRGATIESIGGAALLACLLALSGCRPGSSLTYHVTVSDAIPRQVTVELRLTGLTPGQAYTFRSYARPEDSRFVDVRAEDESGDSLAQRIPPDAGHGIARVHFAAPASGRAVVRYRVSSASKKADMHAGEGASRKILVDDRFALLRGRDLFLFPERPEEVGEARITYTLPKSWRAWSSWTPRGIGSAATRLSGVRTLEEMLVSPVGLGDFRVRRFRVAGTEYRILTHVDIPQAAGDRVSAELESASRVAAARLDRQLEPRYLTLVLPRASDGGEVVGDASGEAQGGTLYPLTTDRLKRFTRRVLDARLLYPPRALPFLAPGDRWFPVGLSEYLSLDIVAEVRGIASESVDRYLGHEYGMVPVDEMRALDLEQAMTDPKAGETTKRLAHDVVAPLAVRALERELGGREPWHRWLREISRRGSIASIWDEVPLTQATRERLRSAWARGRARLPMEFTEEVSEVRDASRHPGRGGAAVARSLRVAITAQTMGYLENCGCKVSQSGGLARRSSLLKRLRSEPEPLVVVDVGSGLADFQETSILDPFAFAEQRAYLEIVSELHYAGLTPGRTDLGRGPGVFDALRSGLPLPYTAANVTRRDGGPLLPAVQTSELEGIRCRVIGVTTTMNPFYVPSALEEALDSLRIEDPVEAVSRATASLPASDFIIVSGEIPYRVIRDIAKKCPKVDLIVACPQMYLGELAPRSEGGTRQQDWPGFLGNTLVAFGNLGAYGVTGVTIGLDADGKVVRAAFDHYELNETVPDDPAVRRSLDRFYASVSPEAAGTAHVETPAAYWAGKGSASGWVGSEACAGCHEVEAAQWRGTPHAGAMRTLTHAHRDAQPRCVSCHVVGFGTQGGYKIGGRTPHLANVQCENCHGPGEAHVESPGAGNIVKHVPEAVCVSCHNPDHSDAFVYEERLPAVVHGTTPARLTGAR